MGIKIDSKFTELISLLSVPRIGKTSLIHRRLQVLYPNSLSKGSKPTKRRLKVKLSRKANVQRLIKNK